MEKYSLSSSPSSPLLPSSERILAINYGPGITEVPITSKSDLYGSNSNISIISKNSINSNQSNPSEGLRVVGPLRLASILFFMAYGGSYGVEGMQ